MSRAILVTVLFGALAVACAEKKSGRPAFDCVRLQKRAEQCEGEILAAARRRMDARHVGSEASGRAAEQSFLRYKRSFQRKLRRRELLEECRKHRGRPSPASRRHVTGLRFCFGRASCRAFAECLVGR